MTAAFTWLHLWLFSCIAMIFMAKAQQFIYNDGFHGANLKLDGSAEILSNGLLQLTNTSRQIGHAFYPFPINFNTSSSSRLVSPINFNTSSSSRLVPPINLNTSSASRLARSLSFSTKFVIAIVPGSKEGTGHGMTFVISASTDFGKADGIQYLGLVNTSTNESPSNHFFAVEFDTINSLDMADIDDNHVGIDLNGVISNKSTPAAYFSNGEMKNISLKNGSLIQVWIDYNHGKKQVNVTLAPKESQKPDHPLLSASIDLSNILMDTMYVGFSSTTGSVESTSGRHYVLGWSFNRNGEAQSLDISQLPKLPNTGSQRAHRIQLISVAAAILLLLIVFGTWYLYRRKKYEEVHEDWEKEYGPQRFSYRTLYKATRGFKDDKQLLGFGGFGKVYKGTLPYSKEQIAVKKVSHDRDQGMKEFVSEVVSMGRLRHKNLVRLLGYCRRKKELLLVYELMENGSLDKFLFDSEKPTLTWFQRYQIIKGVASALLYLHEEWEQVVLHRDIKASNVLLDSNLNGRLGDFGLARLYDRDGDPQTTRLVGTLGYLDPDLTRTGKATKSSDMFAFGAFLLEVACGRKPFETNVPPEEIFLVDLVNRSWKKGAIFDVVDPRLQGNYVVKEMENVVKLGLLCSNPKSDLRPTIIEVVQYLEGNGSLPEDTPLDSTAHNVPSSILETWPQSNSTASDYDISLPSSGWTGVSLTPFPVTDTNLNVGG